MIKFILALLAVFAAAFGFIYLIKSMGTGYVLVAYNGWTLETTVWLGTAVAAIAFVVAYLLVRTLFNLIFAKGKLRRWLGARKDNKQGKLQQQALLGYLTGDYQKSAPIFAKLAKQDMNAEVNYLLAANAQQALGDVKKGQELLNQAEDAGVKASLAARLTQAQLHLAKGDAQRALSLLGELSSRDKQQAQVLALLVQAYQQLNKQYELVALVPNLGKVAYLNGQKSADLIVQICANWLRSANHSNAVELQQRWQKLAKAQQQNSELIALYAEALIKAGAAAEADKLLKNQLKNRFDENMVEVFGRLPSSEPKQQFNLAQSWLQQRPDNAVLLLTLGRLALAAQEFDQAKKYFQNSLAQQASSEGFAELARLHANMGELEQSAQCYQQSLTLGPISLPNLPMPQA